MPLTIVVSALRTSSVRYGPIGQAGVVIVIRPTTALGVLAWLIGGGMVLTGVIELTGRDTEGARPRWRTLTGGAWLVGGLVVLLTPGLTVRVVATPTVNPSPTLGPVRSANSAVAALARPNPTCLSGFVWRVARPDDLVCVPPDSRARVAQENATAGQRVDPARRPNCLSGFVWREAFSGDVVCVTPERRAAVREENRVGVSLRAR